MVELLMNSAINIPQKCNLWEDNVFFYNFKKIVPILFILYDINMYRQEYSPVLLYSHLVKCFQIFTTRSQVSQCTIILDNSSYFLFS